MAPTAPTDADPRAYLETVPNERRRRDSIAMLDLMQAVTGEHGVMWGPSMVGFGSQHYTYASGRDGDWFVVGFAPRSSALTVYGIHYYGPPERLAGLGPHTAGKGCVYIKDLSLIDRDELARLVREAWEHRGMATTNAPHPGTAP